MRYVVGEVIIIRPEGSVGDFSIVDDRCTVSVVVKETQNFIIVGIVGTLSRKTISKNDIKKFPFRVGDEVFYEDIYAYDEEERILTGVVSEIEETGTVRVELYNGGYRRYLYKPFRHTRKGKISDFLKEE
jgi:hypothetical protein